MMMMMRNEEMRIEIRDRKEKETRIYGGRFDNENHFEALYCRFSA
jgi:hypothetical protein